MHYGVRKDVIRIEMFEEPHGNHKVDFAHQCLARCVGIMICFIVSPPPAPNIDGQIHFMICFLVSRCLRFYNELCSRAWAKSGFARALSRFMWEFSHLLCSSRSSGGHRGVPWKAYENKRARARGRQTQKHTSRSGSILPIARARP